MKKIITPVIAFLVVFVSLMLLASFGGSASPSDRVSELKNELSRQQAIYHEYAPIAQQGKIAERHLVLANQKANAIREELKILDGFQQGE